MNLKVIFHINDPVRWQRLLGNVTNLLKDVGQERVETLVLANGEAVKGYVEDDIIEKIRELAEKGVRFLACRNSLKAACEAGLCIEEESLPEYITVVPAGITELVKRQNNGFAYVKP